MHSISVVYLEREKDKSQIIPRLIISCLMKETGDQLFISFIFNSRV